MFDRLAEFMEGLSGRRTFLQRTAMQALALMAAVVGFQRESKAGCGSPYQCCNLWAARQLDSKIQCVRLLPIESLAQTAFGRQSLEVIRFAF